MNAPRFLILPVVGSLLPVLAAHAQDSFSDDFDRPDSNDPGPGWTEQVGDWQIHSGLLRPVQTDDTLEKLISYDEIALDNGFVLEADINWSVRNQWNGLAWNITDGDNHYLFRVRADNGRVQAMKRVDGAFDPVFVNLGDNTVVLDEDTFYRLVVQADGGGNFWWSVRDGDNVLSQGSFFDPDPLEGGSAGFYSGRESIEADFFRIETFDLSSDHPDVRVHTAIEVEFDSIDGVRYQIESSGDLDDWNPTGSPIVGDGDNASRLFPAREHDRRFFRVFHPDAH